MTSTPTPRKTRCRSCTLPGYTDLESDAGRRGRATPSAACPARSTTCSPTRRRSTGVTGVDIWDINASESIAYEYSRYNYNATLFYDDDPFRSSDHDPVLVGLDDAGAAVRSSR